MTTTEIEPQPFTHEGGSYFYRQSLDTSLSDLDTILSEREGDGDYVRVAPGDFEFHLDATDPAFKFGDVEVPATEEALEVVGGFLQVPSAFMKRMTKNTSGSTQNLILGEMMSNMVKRDVAVQVNKTSTNLLALDEFGKHEGIHPHQITSKVLAAFGDSNPQVARLVDERHVFAFDAYSPFDAEDFGIGGDFEEGDLTAAGVRIEINLKQGLTPTVQPYSYRRICTNGMETPMAGIKIEGRGQSVEEVLAEVEGMARLAFAQAEKDIEHFYQMREVRVDNPERHVGRIAREHGIPNRSMVEILRLASSDALPDNPSMFDVVNLVTNFANSPQVRNDGGRILLERAGGAVVADHSSRCGHCLQTV